jgi:hypothetical protein
LKNTKKWRQTMTFKEFVESIVAEYEEEYGPIEEKETEE